LPPREVRLTIDSDLEMASPAGVFLNRVCELAGMGEVERFQIEVCVVEAVNNSIRHSYGGRKNHPIHIGLRLDAEGIFVEVSDNGVPAERKRIEEPRQSVLDFNPADLNGLPEGGMGLPIIRKVMDKVEYTSCDGTNRFRMWKKLQPVP
jgi:serine/threonine-protein kinase RsbW